MTDYIEIAKTLLPADAPETVVNRIAAFVPIASDSILRDSLKEAIGKKDKSGSHPALAAPNFIEKLHKGYNRRFAEMGRLFPIFSIFEGAYRSFVARSLCELFNTDFWWSQAYEIERLRSHPDHHSDPCISQVGEIAVSADLANAIHDFARSIAINKDVRDLVEAGAGTMELIQFTKLSDLERLVVADWMRLKERFVISPPFGSATFAAQFAKVRAARNTIFHHRDIKQKAAIVSAAEELLNLIGVHLKTLFEDATHVAVSPNQFAMPARLDHHHNLQVERLNFSVTAHFGDKETTAMCEGTCTGDAFVRYLHSLKASRVGDLNSLKLFAAAE